MYRRTRVENSAATNPNAAAPETRQISALSKTMRISMLTQRAGFVSGMGERRIWQVNKQPHKRPSLRASCFAGQGLPLHAFWAASSAALATFIALPQVGRDVIVDHLRDVDRKSVDRIDAVARRAVLGRRAFARRGLHSGRAFDARGAGEKVG